MTRSKLLVAAGLVLVSAGLLKAQGGASSAPPPSSSAGKPSLDYEFFKDKVEPIFLQKRPGHARCVSCHAVNNVRLHLVPLSPDAAAWNDEQSRKNFELIKRVAFPGDLESPLLIHALVEDAGGDFFHSGGKHFNSQNDPEWLTLKAFVMGQTVKAGQ